MRKRNSNTGGGSNSTYNRRFLICLAASIVLIEVLRNVHTVNHNLGALTLYLDQQQPTAAHDGSVTVLNDGTVTTELSSSAPWWGPIAGTPLTPAFSSGKNPVSASRVPQIAKPHVCGLPWNSFLQGLTFDDWNGPLLWTVSGGDEYRQYVGMLLDHWALRVEPDLPMLVVALDAATARRVCSLGYMAVYWEAGVQSYSRVADAKVQASAEWAERGIDALFIELDVFCRTSLVPLLLDYQAKDDTDLVTVGHGDVNKKINIGVYYVKGNNNTARFFRSLQKLLEPSLMTKGYINDIGNAGGFFDQDSFSACLRYKKGQGWWLKEDYETNKTDATNLLKLAGCDSHNLTSTMVSNLQISSFNPPIVVDSTYCVHPLDNRPFTSFRTKLATAKFLGFDPTVVGPEERLLKTMSGDISPSETWGDGFLAKNFHDSESDGQSKFQHYVAALIKLAMESNRTLVLPRHVRDQKGAAYPVYALVGTASIGEMVDWRFMSQNEALALERSTQTIVMPTDMDSAVSATQACDDKVCAIQGLTKAGKLSNPDLDDIISNLTWCLGLEGKHMRDAGHFIFQSTVGGFAKPCVPHEPRKPKRKDVVTPFLGA